MYFRFQAFCEDRQLVRGWARADSAAEARAMLEEMFVCLAQFERVRRIPHPLHAADGPTFTSQTSEQWIPETPPRNVVVRTDAGPVERRLVGHVERLGGREYLQLWACMAVYVLAALAMWWIYPPAQAVDLKDWYEPEHHERLERMNAPVYRSALLALGNSGVSFLGMLVLLAKKRPLGRLAVGIALLYAFQWVALASLLRISGEAYGAVHFLRDHAIYTLLAWLVPVAAITAAERALRQALDLTVPVYEDPATRRLEMGSKQLIAA